MDRNYGGVIWTNHVLERLIERGIKQGDAWAVWRNPDSSEYSSLKGAWIYKRKFGNETIEIVAKKNDKNGWIILSVWNKFDSKEVSKKFDLFFVLKKLFSFSMRKKGSGPEIKK